MLKLLGRLLGALFSALMVPILLFEEWGWEQLQAAMARLMRWPPLAALDRRIARLPPYAALAILMLPTLTILPIKLVGVWLLTRGYVLWSLVLVLGAKLAGTAVLAHLFALTKPALMRLDWFARAFTRWTAWKDGLLAQVRASWPWRLVRAWRHRAGRAWARWRAAAK